MYVSAVLNTLICETSIILFIPMLLSNINFLIPIPESADKYWYGLYRLNFQFDYIT